MILKNLISSYTRYNHWVNERMTQWLKTLDSGILYNEALSSFGSIDLTVQHMVHAQNFWYAVITEGDLTKLDETIKVNAADRVMNDLLSCSHQMIVKFAAYTEEELVKQIPTTDIVKCRYEYMLHVINHNSYHRGQIVTISRGHGIVHNIPVTDYDAFLWAEST